jgi:hypothetical protein
MAVLVFLVVDSRYCVLAFVADLYREWVVRWGGDVVCKDCELKYIGQTERTFRTRYKEHIREIKTNGQKSKFAQHILDTTHNYDTIEQTMEILHLEKKGKMLSALESYHI